MKEVYEIISATDFEGPYEVSDDFPVKYPYTNKKIPEGCLQPSFDFNLNEWVDLTPPILKEELIAQKKAQEELAEQTTETQLALAEVYELVLGGTE